VLGVFKDVITAPEFRQDKITLARTQLRGAIAAVTTTRAAWRIANSPTSYTAKTRPTVDMQYATWTASRAATFRISTSDILPANIVLGRGRLRYRRDEGKIEKLFADWTSSSHPCRSSQGGGKARRASL